jgi:uncharacterized membrane protein YhaH (DUF805 family)
MNWYLAVLKKYATFDGRARRKEYWMFFLFNFLATMVLSILSGFVSILGILSLVYGLGTLLPSIGAAIRRLHDTGHSGWWLLVPLVPIVFMVQAGTAGDNQYGSDPLNEPEPA